MKRNSQRPGSQSARSRCRQLAHAVAVVGVDAAGDELRVREPFLGRVAEQAHDLRAHEHRPHRLLHAVQVGDERQVLDQGAVAMLRRAEVDLRHHRRCEAFGDLDLGVRPGSRETVDVAEDADGLTRGARERHAEIGADAELVQQRLAPGQRMGTRVVDRERCAGRDHVPADRPGERDPMTGRDLGKAGEAGEDDLVDPGVGERHERRRGTEGLRGQLGQPVERVVVPVPPRSQGVVGRSGLGKDGRHPRVIGGTAVKFDRNTCSEIEHVFA